MPPRLNPGRVAALRLIFGGAGIALLSYILSETLADFSQWLFRDSPFTSLAPTAYNFFADHWATAVGTAVALYGGYVLAKK